MAARRVTVSPTIEFAAEPLPLVAETTTLPPVLPVDPVLVVVTVAPVETPVAFDSNFA
jgi:hypothetical protein